MCDNCKIKKPDGSWVSTGVEPDPIPVPPPSVESIMAAGFSADEAAAILLWEEHKEKNGGNPPPPKAPEPAVPTSAPASRVGLPAKRKTGGPDMTITSELGPNELVCEWEFTDDAGRVGKNSAVFDPAVLIIGA